MIAALDLKLIRIFRNIVYVWCEVTGKSNFVLARILLVLCALCLVADTVIFFLQARSERPSSLAVFVQLAILWVWGTGIFRSWKYTFFLEQEVKKMEHSDTIPTAVFLVFERQRIWRFLIFGLTVFVLSFHFLAISKEIQFNTIFMVLFFISLFCYQYVLLCFNSGGGGFRKLIAKLARIRLWHNPVARPGAA